MKEREVDGEKRKMRTRWPDCRSSFRSITQFSCYIDSNAHSRTLRLHLIPSDSVVFASVTQTSTQDRDGHPTIWF